MIRKFEFNCISVIESLPHAETQTGTILYDDLLKRISYKIDFLKTSLIKAHNKIGFFTELEKIKILASNGNFFPLIHFEVHGCNEGLVLASKELVTWLELTNRLREINIIIRNNLFVSFATCYSAYIYGAVLPSQPSPFFAFIGTWETISEGDIMQNYYEFFETMLSIENLPKINFQAAVRKLNNGEDVKYHFYNSEQIFDRVMDDYNKNLQDKNATKKRIEYLIAEAYKSEMVRKIPKEIIRKQIEILLFDQNEATHASFKKQFLMS